MTSWILGRSLLRVKIEAESLPLETFVADALAQKLPRIKGTAVFLSGGTDRTPRALLHNFKHNRALHERVIVLSVLTEEVPFVADEDRVSLRELQAQIYCLHIRFGFMETPDVPAVLRLIAVGGQPVDPLQTSFFLGKETLVASRSIRMANWRKWVFSYLSINATSASAFFRLPPNRVVEFGSQIEF